MQIKYRYIDKITNLFYCFLVFKTQTTFDEEIQHGLNELILLTFIDVRLTSALFITQKLLLYLC